MRFTGNQRYEQPEKGVETLTSTVWGLAEAIRTDNNSVKLDNLGPRYGIVKDTDGNYRIENNIPTLKEKGVDYFKVKNNITFVDGNYNFEPVIEMYNKEGEQFIVDQPIYLNELAGITTGLLEATNYLQPNK